MKEDAEALIWTAAGSAAVAGFINPVPFAGDLVILSTAWTVMLVKLAKIYSIEFDQKTFKIIAFEALKSVGAYAMRVLAFVYLFKYTFIGTIPAALTNAALNFGFTAGVGFLYSNAWAENKEPSSKDIADLLKNTIDFFKAGFTKAKRKQMANQYKESTKQGKSKKQSISEILKSFFEGYFE